MNQATVSEPSFNEILDAPPPKAVDRLLQRWRLRKARRFVPPGARVLDVGCSDGALFRFLGGRISGGLGLDTSLRRPVEGPGYRLLPGSFPEGIPNEERFDAIVMLAVVEHMPEAALRRLPEDCARFLRPGGRVIITVPSPAVDRVLHLLMRFRLIAGMHVHEHYGFDPWGVPDLFRDGELRLKRAQRFQLGLNNLFVFERPG